MIIFDGHSSSDQEWLVTSLHIKTYPGTVFKNLFQVALTQPVPSLRGSFIASGGHRPRQRG